MTTARSSSGLLILLEKMAGVTGLEPATSGVTGRHSNQLSYTPAGCTGNTMFSREVRVIRPRKGASQAYLTWISEVLKKPSP